MDKANTGLGAGLKRENFWSELTTEEKLERSRQKIKNLSKHLSQAQLDIHMIKEALKHHSHSDKGIVVPWNEYQNNTVIESASIHENDYF
jgi:hypothetical protein